MRFAPNHFFWVSFIPRKTVHPPKKNHDSLDGYILSELSEVGTWERVSSVDHSCALLTHESKRNIPVDIRLGK